MGKMSCFSVLSGGALIKVDGVRILMERVGLELRLNLFDFVSSMESVISWNFNLF